MAMKSSRVFAALIGLVLIAVGCTGSRDNSQPERPAPLASRPSKPFSVVAPAGHDLKTAEQGRQYTPWGDDSSGNVDPFTVLSPHGSDASSARAVVVSVTGFAGYEGGLDQASPGGGPGVRSERFKVGGRDAIFTPAQTAKNPSVRRFEWSDLVVARSRDLAVRVRVRGGTKDQLVDIERRVEPRGRTMAPGVSEPPSGYEVVGSIDVGAVVAENLDVDTYALTNDAFRTGPGNPVVHRMTWTGADEGSGLALITVPSRLATLSAIPGLVAFAGVARERRAHQIDVSGRTGVLIEEVLPGAPTAGFSQRMLYAETTWGNLIIIVAWGRGTPSGAQLATMAASVTPVAATAWPVVPTGT
jgi:hypothetical protein